MASGRGSTVLRLRLRRRAARHVPERVKQMIARASARPGLTRRLVALANGDLRHKDLTIETGVAAGLRFNSADSVCGYALGMAEPDVQEALARVLSPGMVVYDIGANIGFFTVIAARLVGPHGRVLAFDPLPENVRWLRHNIALNGFEHVDVIEAAVGAEERTARLAEAEAGVWARISETGEHRVPMMRLDDRIVDGSLPAPDVVKIDIEGYEVQALDGMGATLADHRPVVIVELHDTLAPVCAALRAAGYGITRIDPHEPDIHGHLLARWTPAATGSASGTERPPKV